MSVNKTIILGNVGQDPEVRTLEGGVKVASFSIATTEKYTNKQGEKVENTEWHNIEVWNGLAEVVEKYVKKGMQLYIEGKLKTHSWEKEGHKFYQTTIRCTEMQMLGRKGDNAPAPSDDKPF